MRFLASMPELCDVTFLVGDTREPVCAVRAVLAARSRYSHPKYQLSARCPCRAQLVQPSKIAAKCVLSLPRANHPLPQDVFFSKFCRTIPATRRRHLKLEKLPGQQPCGYIQWPINVMSRSVHKQVPETRNWKISRSVAASTSPWSRLCLTVLASRSAAACKTGADQADARAIDALIHLCSAVRRESKRITQSVKFKSTVFHLHDESNAAFAKPPGTALHFFVCQQFLPVGPFKLIDFVWYYK